jgi:hypothetical protein
VTTAEETPHWELMRRRAHARIAKGYHVFPLRLVPSESGKMTKVPATSAARSASGARWGCTTDPRQVDEWWAPGSRTADCLVGIATEESGVVVVDQDVTAEVDGIAAWRALCPDAHPIPASLGKSPSGSVHAYYRADPQCPIKTSAGEVAPGVDTRGMGGMVVDYGQFLPRPSELPPVPEVVKARVPHGGTSGASPAEQPAGSVLILPTGPAAVREPVPSQVTSGGGQTGGVLLALPSFRRFTGEQAADYCRPAMDRLRRAGRGRINWELNAAATQLGHFVPAFWAEADVRGWLLEAQRVAWLASGGADDGDYRAAEDTIRSGLRRGMAEPYERVEPHEAPGATAAPSGADAPVAADPLAPAGEERTERRASWSRTDLSSILDGSDISPTATLMPRADGVCLLYPGMTHSLHGESESGKTWIVLAEVARLLQLGEPVAYLDFESDARVIVSRLLELGVPAAAIAEHLDYRRPEASPALPFELEHWHDLMSHRYALAVIDGVTEALVAFGRKGREEDDVAWFLGALPDRLAALCGAAVVMIDHVTKDPETRGRFAQGSQHKMSGLSGAAYVADVAEPLGRGMRGELVLRVAKDRHGRIRPEGGPHRSTDRTQEVARFVLDGTSGSLVATLEPWREVAKAADGGFRPTGLMEHVSRWLDANPGSSLNAIKGGVRGKADMIARAVEVLVSEGFVTALPGPRNTRSHTNVQPYVEAADELATPLERGPRLVPLTLPGTGSHRVPTESGTGGAVDPPTESRVPSPYGEGLGRGTARQDQELERPVPDLVRPASCPCGLAISNHARSQWSTSPCQSCGQSWHAFGAKGSTKCSCRAGEPDGGGDAQ